METGVIVARFQAPVMPAFAERIVNDLRKNHRHLIVVLGQSPLPGSKNNPLSVDARRAMIKAAFPDVGVLSLKDHPLDEKWSQELDKLLADKSIDVGNSVLYGSQDSFVSRYSGKYKTAALPRSESHDEQNIIESADSVEFRMGRAHAFQNAYPKVFPTVDVALFRNNKAELLLGRKSLENGWRLIGGFADPTDESYEAAAKRELNEEAGELSTRNWLFENSFKIDDWRYRYEQDKIISCLFSAELVSGDASGSDDLAEVKWFVLSEVRRLVDHGETVSEHQPLLEHLLKKYL